jgi:hypothetical protein
MLSRFKKDSKFLDAVRFVALRGILSVFLPVFWCQPSQAQSLTYIEPENSRCPTSVSPASAQPKTVRAGVPVVGSIKVSCGFSEGSYTVSLGATDSEAVFLPKTFLVNFGRLVGPGKFTVKFETAGEQTIFATITSNMGSPVLRGKFSSDSSFFNVVR